MSEDLGQEFRRLIKKHRIFYKPYKNEVPFPAEHKETFEDIVELGRYKFDKYSANIDIRLKNEPWRKQTKSRVRWLSKRAEELKGQRRNESGWRLCLEDHVLHRFFIEVAW